ncbi:unnamed protein product [Hermetia illucens]|uniref:Uncharacterized protein n=2 Tax=Hermetia illucens TaxID=343691 RepID=A0A7R8YSW9_HERIL|nr:unnamed protein product [Hermetia illucens]
MVPPFSYQSLQKNTKVIPPRKTNPFAPQPIKATLFQKFFLRGDIPANIKPVEPGAKVVKKTKKTSQDPPPLVWDVPPESLDYSYYLPIFVEGLGEMEDPYKAVASQGVTTLIAACPEKILPVVPQLIIPMKRALNTREPTVIIRVLKAIQQMVTEGPCVGQALVPYYRQILPICNLFRDVNVNLGEGIDFKRDTRLGDVIEDTLQILEKYGGPDAYINIKYMVPTYESCVMN